MSATGRLRWLLAVLFFGVVYVVVGRGFAALAQLAASDERRLVWRLAAWAISAAAFATHIYYEHVRFGSSPATTALHASLAVGLGAFGLAAGAILHGQAVGRHFPVIALVAWPVLMALPAFAVALVAAAVLARVRRGI